MLCFILCLSVCVCIRNGDLKLSCDRNCDYYKGIGNGVGMGTVTMVKVKADDLYRGSTQFDFVHWTLCRCQQYGACSMKALARYQIILLGEQRHIRCEELAEGCCPNNAAVGGEPTTS